MSGLDEVPVFELVEDEVQSAAARRLLKAATQEELAAALELARAWLLSGPHPQRLVDEINTESEEARLRIDRILARHRR